MRASELMTTNPTCCTPSDSVQDAARLMGAYDVGSLPVVEGKNGGRLVGIVTDRDLALNVVAEGRFDSTVGDVMTTEPRRVREDDDIMEVERIMTEDQVRRVPVVNRQGEVVGVIAQADLALSRKGVSEQQVARVVGRISEPAEAARR
jgi:CBS domain-containing protein